MLKNPSSQGCSSTYENSVGLKTANEQEEPSTPGSSLWHEETSLQWAVDLLIPAPEADLTMPSRQVEALTELQALRHAAYLGERQKRRGYSIAADAVSTASIEVVGHYAEPLSPLRHRDVKALTDLFQRDDIYAIEVDISQILLRLLPEPCWEDEPFEFLKDFLEG